MRWRLKSTVYSRRRSKKTSKLRVSGLCAGNSPVAGEFPAQRSSNAENVSISRRHHATDWCGRFKQSSHFYCTYRIYQDTCCCHITDLYVTVFLFTWYFIEQTIYLKCVPKSSMAWRGLTHWGRDKMTAIFQTTFSNAFSWIIIFEFRLIFHWNLFPRVQLTISQRWFR